MMRKFVPTCFASTAAVYSLPKLSSVMETSSRMMLKSRARSISSRLTNKDTCNIQLPSHTKYLQPKLVTILLLQSYPYHTHVEHFPGNSFHVWKKYHETCEHRRRRRWKTMGRRRQGRRRVNWERFSKVKGWGLTLLMTGQQSKVTCSCKMLVTINMML